MDLTWPSDLELFREEVRRWLASELQGRRFPKIRRPDTIGPLRDWEATLYAAGFAAVDWPAKWGGGGLDAVKSSIFFSEYAAARGPRRLNRQAMGLAGPTLMLHGTPAQQERWLPRMVSCDDIWCQGFSEPDSGSDLASLRTLAVREWEYYVVTGQKTWSSNAPLANWMFALVRTDRELPRHRGLTYLMIDLTAPGIEVRPIQQLDGNADFAEVFFEGVRVPVENRIGLENDGWRVAMSTLRIERGIGTTNAAEMDVLVLEVEKIFDQVGSLHQVDGIVTNRGHSTAPRCSGREIP